MYIKITTKGKVYLIWEIFELSLYVFKTHSTISQYRQSDKCEAFKLPDRQSIKNVQKHVCYCKEYTSKAAQIYFFDI